MFIEGNEARSVAETLSGLLGTRGRAAGWCAEVKKAPAQCCERLAGHEGAMFQRVRLAVLFLVNAPITTATVPRGAYGPTRKSGGFAIWRPAMFRTGLV